MWCKVDLSWLHHWWGAGNVIAYLLSRCRGWLAWWWLCQVGRRLLSGSSRDLCVGKRLKWVMAVEGGSGMFICNGWVGKGWML